MKPKSSVELLEAPLGKAALGRASRSVFGKRTSATEGTKEEYGTRREFCQVRKKVILLVP